MTSCADCLGWGRTYAQGVCLACYNFAATRFRQHLGRCAACRRQVRLKRGYCRLCWCQAREDRAVSALDARSRVVLAGFVAQVGCHQLFLADLYRPKAHPRTAPRRRGVKGRPLKQPPPIAVRPRSDGAQLPLLPDLPRTYRPATVDLRSAATPDNPWLAWALHLAHTTAEARGFDPMVRRALNRNLVMLLATHTDGDRVRASEFHRVIRNHGGALIHVIDVLAAMDVLHDDRPPVFDTWLAAKLDQLAPGIAEHDPALGTRAAPWRTPPPSPPSRHRDGLPERCSAPRCWAGRAPTTTCVRSPATTSSATSTPWRPSPGRRTLTALRSLFGLGHPRAGDLPQPGRRIRGAEAEPTRSGSASPTTTSPAPSAPPAPHRHGSTSPWPPCTPPDPADPRAAPRRRRSRQPPTHHRRHTAPARRPHPSVILDWLATGPADGHAPPTRTC